MSHSALDKRPVSAVVAVSFVAVSISGLLLFLHVRGGVILTIHEWTGLLFTGAGAVHLMLNWKTLVSYGRHKSVHRAIVGTLIFILLLAIAGMSRRSPRPHPDAPQDPVSSRVR